MRAESREVKRDRCSAPDVMIDALYRESVQHRCPKRPGLFKTGKMAIHRSLRRSCFPDGTYAATTRPASLHLRARARKLTKRTEDYKTYINKQIQTTRNHTLKQKGRTYPFLAGQSCRCAGGCGWRWMRGCKGVKVDGWSGIEVLRRCGSVFAATVPGSGSSGRQIHVGGCLPGACRCRSMQ